LITSGTSERARRPTMGAREQYEIPAGLKGARERFEQWRSSQTGRRTISESLWVLASELARQHGVFRTAQVLGRLQQAQAAHAEDGFGRERHISRFESCAVGAGRLIQVTPQILILVAVEPIDARKGIDMGIHSGGPFATE
jgi:hypothetical protein